MNTSGLEFWLTCKYIISEFLDKILITDAFDKHLRIKINDKNFE